MRIAIAGGGTAGHVNPALALARHLEGHQITFIGTARGVESTLVPAHGFDLKTIEVVGFDRSKPAAIFGVGLRAFAAVNESREILRRFDADVVVGMGGYVSLPATFAAKARRIPVVLHEQNIVLGLANKVSKPIAAAIGVSFEATLAATGRKGIHTGNPVMPELAALDHAAARRAGLERFDLDPDRKTLLVFGGSLGAQRVNLAASGLATLWAARSDLQILHITGKTQYESLKGAPTGVHGQLIYRLVPYVEAMGEAYGVADLALCRGGATTVAELGVVAVPSIVVPYPHHRDRQQERHGEVLEQAGAAVVLQDADTSAPRVAALADELLGDPGRLRAMSEAALRLGRPDAAARLVSLVLEAAS